MSHDGRPNEGSEAELQKVERFMILALQMEDCRLLEVLRYEDFERMGRGSRDEPWAEAFGKPAAAGWRCIAG